MKSLPLINQGAESITPTVVRFDGHDFVTDIFAQYGWAIYLAYRARAGDGGAEELLNAFKVTIESAKRGVNYWPPMEAK